MIYIQKRKTPPVIEKEAEKIKNDKDNGYEGLTLPKGSAQLRYLFDKMPKDEIRETLYQEQHGLCAYCMKRINGHREDTRIEHYLALSKMIVIDLHDRARRYKDRTLSGIEYQ